MPTATKSPSQNTEGEIVCSEIDGVPGGKVNNALVAWHCYKCDAKLRVRPKGQRFLVEPCRKCASQIADNKIAKTIDESGKIMAEAQALFEMELEKIKHTFAKKLRLARRKQATFKRLSAKKIAKEAIGPETIRAWRALAAIAWVQDGDIFAQVKGQGTHIKSLMDLDDQQKDLVRKVNRDMDKHSFRIKQGEGDA